MPMEDINGEKKEGMKEKRKKKNGKEKKDKNKILFT